MTGESNEAPPLPPIEVRVEPAACAAASMQRYVTEQNDAIGRAALVSGEPPQYIRPSRLADRMCGACGGRAGYDSFDQLEAPDCLSSGSCERDWVRKYPEAYLDEQGQPLVRTLPCRGEGCGALLRLALNSEGKLRGRVTGDCKVEEGGRAWRAFGRATLDAMVSEQDFSEIEDDSERL